MGLSFHDCGACIGCEIKHRQTVFIERLDREVFMPKLQRLAERYDPPGSQVHPDPGSYESLAIRRERRELLEYRSHMIGEVVKSYGYAGCCRLVISPGDEDRS